MLRPRSGSCAPRLATRMRSRCIRFNSRSEVRACHPQRGFLLAAALPTEGRLLPGSAQHPPLQNYGVYFQGTNDTMTLREGASYVKSFYRSISSSFTALLIHFCLRAFAIGCCDMGYPLPWSPADQILFPPRPSLRSTFSLPNSFRLYKYATLVLHLQTSSILPFSVEPVFRDMTFNAEK